MILNPKTNRPIKGGSGTFNVLVKEGFFSENSNYKDDNVCTEYGEIPEDQLENTINEINQKLPLGTHAVRGRGKYANKIVKRKNILQ